MAFQHVVLFRFPTPLTPGEDEEIRAMVEGWRTVIPGMRLLRFGSDVSGRAQGWQYLLVEELDDEAAFQAYVVHPLHQAYRAWIDARKVEVMAFDYEVDPGT